MGVVLLDVLPQHRLEVARSGHQEVVEAFAAQGANPALGDRVRARCSRRGADVGAGEDRVDGGGEPAVAVGSGTAIGWCGRRGR